MSEQSISLIDEFHGAISLADAIKDGWFLARPHLSCVNRWSTVGVRGVKLETVKVGSRRMVTRAAVEAFLSALNADRPRNKPKVKADTKRRGRNACDALEKIGC